MSYEKYYDPPKENENKPLTKPVETALEKYIKLSLEEKLQFNKNLADNNKYLL